MATIRINNRLHYVAAARFLCPFDFLFDELQVMLTQFLFCAGTTRLVPLIFALPPTINPPKVLANNAADLS